MGWDDDGEAYETNYPPPKRPRIEIRPPQVRVETVADPLDEHWKILEALHGFDHWR